jgi:octaprenyl-diphosphate synthase
VGELEQSDDDLAEAMRLMERHGAIAATLARAREFAAEAKRALLVFPASPMRARLMDVADYTVSRAS